MNMVSGIYYPDEGEIFVDGKPVVIASPKDAFDYKIGMIHHHFKLIDVLRLQKILFLELTTAKNLILKRQKSEYAKLLKNTVLL